MYDNIRQQDPAVYDAMMRELQRQRDHIELIASENFVSPAVMEAMGSHLTNKYAEGYPGARYYGGCQYVDEVENLARDRAVQLFGAEHANVQPHSGSQANVSVYLALLKPGDTILGIVLSHGGHLTHGSKASISGKYFNACFYGVDPETETIDYDKVRQRAEECRPKLIIAGASAYPRFIDFKRMREIADSVGRVSYGRHGAHRRTCRSRGASESWFPMPTSSRRLRTRPCAGRAARSSSARRSLKRR